MLGRLASVRPRDVEKVAKNLPAAPKLNELNPLRRKKPGGKKANWHVSPARTTAADPTADSVHL